MASSFLSSFIARARWRVAGSAVLLAAAG